MGRELPDGDDADAVGGDDPFGELLQPGFAAGAVVHEPSADERAHAAARAQRAAELQRRLAEEEAGNRRRAKRSRRRSGGQPGQRRFLSMVGPVLAVIFVAGMAWVQFQGDGTPFSTTSEGPPRPENYPPPDESASDGPLGVPPPIPQPAGPYEFKSTQTEGTGPVAWDPCRPVRYVVNPARSPRGGDELIRVAVERAAAATGLVFIDEGVTDEVWSKEREPYQPDRYGERWAPALIAWSDDSEVPSLGGYIAGLGGGIAASDSEGWRAYVSGGLVLDAADMAEVIERPDGDRQARAIIQHEIGHLLGLDHVADQTQLMFSGGSDVADWGSGDLAGLHQLGSGSCLPDL